MSTTYSTDQVAAATGLSLRQLDYYVRRGYLHLADPLPGSGQPRRYTHNEALQAAILAELVRVGLTPTTAAVVADAGGEFTAGHTRIATDTRAVENDLRSQFSQQQEDQPKEAT